MSTKAPPIATQREIRDRIRERAREEMGRYGDTVVVPFGLLHYAWALKKLDILVTD